MSDEIVEAAASRRRLSGMLLLGLIVMPLIFVWFLLRKGYSTPLRLGAFAYAAMCLGFGVLQVLGSRTY